jgi:MFS family permease
MRRSSGMTSTSTALLLSTSMVKLMSATTGASFVTWGWRIPFLASAVLVAIGLITVPSFGLLSDLIGRRVTYGTGIVATTVVAFPYFGLLDTRSAGLVLLPRPPRSSEPQRAPAPPMPSTIHSTVAELDNSAVERPPSSSVVELGSGS